MGTIRQEIELIKNGKRKKESSVIDTGASRTVIKEDILTRDFGLKPIAKEDFLFGGEKTITKNLYLIDFKIGKCKMPNVVVMGGKKNLIGHDILQRSQAVIDEKEHTVYFPYCDGISEL